MKGFQRSLARGIPFSQNVVRTSYLFSGSFVVANGSTAPGIGSLVIGDFPKGNLLLLAARVQGMVFRTADADAIATWDGDWSVGSVPNADADLTDATDFDIVGVSGGQAIGAATAKVSPVQDVTSAKNAIIDNRDDSKEINLNVLVDDASQSGDISMTVKGVLELVYIVL